MKEKLDEEQVSSIKSWADDGVSLGNIQKQLETEFGMKLTFIETRFLLSDLGIGLSDHIEKEKDRAKEEEKLIKKDKKGVDDSLGSSGGTNVTLDSITKVGTIMSGKVVFGDGKGANWSINQMGGLDLDPDEVGYKPSQESLMEFQKKLQDLLSKQGGI